MASEPAFDKRFKRKLTNKQITQMLTDIHYGMSNIDAANKYGISKNTVWHYKSKERKPLRRVDPCGTIGAYRRHRNAGEKPCFECKLAWAAKQAEYDKARKDKRKAARDNNSDVRERNDP